MIREVIPAVGIRLRNYRLQKGYSQERLAELAGVHPTYIGQIERGEKNITIESLAKITRALSVSMSQVFEKLDGGEGDGQGYPLRAYELFADCDREMQEKLYHILEEIYHLK